MNLSEILFTSITTYQAKKRINIAELVFTGVYISKLYLRVVLSTRQLILWDRNKEAKSWKSLNNIIKV